MSTQPPSRPETLLTVFDVAARTKLSTRHIWRLTASGKFPQPIRLGRRCKRWSAVQVDAYIRELTIKSITPPQSVNVFDLSQYQD